ncbi:unnamed protein product [Vitrella brassicaformis CCMP3155]|uniref:Uncharacterized protein n=1 Tax=Vitrella brassicaformis (strain CCMP3155) TaxID=1169540 RepID=A0A0G4H4X1_VITBC|nr:unnamed protein product [Vitrella brassicaformis CCMP3155]|mmetsp:Transcript_4355/g.9967  ORF Transcript_4355/g.9967 Transcript_4355/m.9967 type:complete len:298 (-) Transcript_4355:266-1159(-)|eukprot:CEM38727.1 unnamed protein product [Vitrella brassicaformis CCMP3155]
MGDATGPKKWACDVVKQDNWWRYLCKKEDQRSRMHPAYWNAIGYDLDLNNPSAYDPMTLKYFNTRFREETVAGKGRAVKKEGGPSLTCPPIEGVKGATATATNGKGTSRDTQPLSQSSILSNDAHYMAAVRDTLRYVADDIDRHMGTRGAGSGKKVIQRPLTAHPHGHLASNSRYGKDAQTQRPPSRLGARTGAAGGGIDMLNAKLARPRSFPQTNTEKKEGKQTEKGKDNDPPPTIDTAALKHSFPPLSDFSGAGTASMLAQYRPKTVGRRPAPPYADPRNSQQVQKVLQSVMNCL